MRSTLARVLRRRINVVLAAVPLALLASIAHLPSLTVAGLLALALWPLSTFLGEALQRLEDLAPQRAGALLSAFLFNVDDVAIGLAVLLPLSGGAAIGALEGTITGTLLLNLLAVTGVAALIGAWHNGRMIFSAETVGGYSSLLALPALALVLPAVVASSKTTLSSGGSLPLTCAIAGALLLFYLGYIVQTLYGDRLDAAAHRRRLRAQRRRLGSDGTRHVADVDRLLAEEVELEQVSELDRQEEEIRRKQPHRLRRAAEMAGVAVVTGAAFVGVSIWFNAAIQGALDADPNLRRYELFAGFVFLPLLQGLGDIAPLAAAARRHRMEEVFAVTCSNAYTTIAGVVPIVVLVAAALGHPTFLIFQPFSLVLDCMVLAYFWYICVTGELSAFAAFSLCLIWAMVGIALLPWG